MKKSESTKNIFLALNKVCTEIRNPYNSANNPFYKSKYAPLDDVLNLVRPILAVNGLAFIQSPVSIQGDNGLMVGVEGLLTHSSGEWVEYEPFFFPVPKGTAQDAGSCITYARRYQVTAVFNIMGDNDDDGNDASGNTDTKSPAKPTAQKAPTKPDEKLICADCKKEITNSHGKTAASMAIGTEKMCEKKLCYDCFKKWQVQQELKKTAEGFKQ